MSFVTIGPDNSRYSNKIDDLRINISSGILTLGDGSGGGMPIADPTFGFPENLNNQVERPSGIEGWTLQYFMNEFPEYSRISEDNSSLGAQLLTPASMVADDIYNQAEIANNELYTSTYPVYEQGVIYEYDFNKSRDLDTYPSVSGRVGDHWFLLPMTRSADQFWLSPPTRFETTTSEIFNINYTSWQSITESGITTIDMPTSNLPMHDRLLIEISEANDPDIDASDRGFSIYGEINIIGRWPQDSLRAGLISRRETIIIDRNGPFLTKNKYRSIESIEVAGLPVGAKVKTKVLNFTPNWRSDELVKHVTKPRNSQENIVAWQNINEYTNFNSVIQTEAPTILSTSGQSYLARTYSNQDTFQEGDIEFEVIDFWALNSREGIPISGVIDIKPIPSTRYILALDRASNIHVFDTFIPTLNMGGRTPVSPSPIHLETSWPASVSGNQETAGSYTLRVDPRYSAGQSASSLQRWQWRLTKGGSDYVITDESTLTALNEKEGWRQHSSGTLSPISVTIDSPGQYTIELRTVDGKNQRHTSTTSHRKISKNAITTCPINGLAGNPIGIDIDSYGRPWVQTSTSGACRLAMRNDIGYWLPEQKLLITREPYDEVRKNNA